MLRYSKLEQLLPPHKAGLSLRHNPQMGVGITVKEWLNYPGRETEFAWPSDHAKARSIDTNELWILTWYPEFPLISHEIAAPTLAGLLEFAAKIAAGDDRGRH